jgi:hypothetical protein
MLKNKIKTTSLSELIELAVIEECSRICMGFTTEGSTILVGLISCKLTVVYIHQIRSDQSLSRVRQSLFLL